MPDSCGRAATPIIITRQTDAHKDIVRHARALKGAKAQVKLYDVVS
jgi:hypothetical protein